MINVLNPAAVIAALKQQLNALKQDRDCWRRQHDFVMDDWKADLAQVNATADDLCWKPLAELLRFYDSTTGAVSGWAGTELVSDAFNRALLTLAIRG